MVQSQFEGRERTDVKGLYRDHRVVIHIPSFKNKLSAKSVYTLSGSWGLLYFKKRFIGKFP
jgi:hypothetical protein